MKIEIKVKGLNDFVKNLGNAKGAFEPLARTAINKSLLEIKEKARNNAPIYEGNLQRGFKHDVNRLVGTLWNTKNYAIFVEKGTRPHFPPVAPLEKWALKKLGKSGLGFVIARKISRKGTEAQPFFYPAVESSLKSIQLNFDNMINQLSKIIIK